MTHKMHTCTSEAAPAILEALQHAHGWPHEKIPLNVEFSRRLGHARHEKCPYCGLPSDQFEDVPAEDVQRLQVNLRASGSMNRPQAQYKAENASLARELRALREEVSALRKSQGGSS